MFFLFCDEVHNNKKIAIGSTASDFFSQFLIYCLGNFAIPNPVKPHNIAKTIPLQHKIAQGK